MTMSSPEEFMNMIMSMDGFKFDDDGARPEPGTRIQRNGEDERAWWKSYPTDPYDCDASTLAIYFDVKTPGSDDVSIEHKHKFTYKQLRKLYSTAPIFGLDNVRYDEDLKPIFICMRIIRVDGIIIHITDPAEIGCATSANRPISEWCYDDDARIPIPSQNSTTKMYVSDEAIMRKVFEDTAGMQSFNQFHRMNMCGLSGWATLMHGFGLRTISTYDEIMDTILDSNADINIAGSADGGVALRTSYILPGNDRASGGASGGARELRHPKFARIAATRPYYNTVPEYRIRELFNHFIESPIRNIVPIDVTLLSNESIEKVAGEIKRMAYFLPVSYYMNLPIEWFDSAIKRYAAISGQTRDTFIRSMMALPNRPKHCTITDNIYNEYVGSVASLNIAKTVDLAFHKMYTVEDVIRRLVRGPGHLEFPSYRDIALMIIDYDKLPYDGQEPVEYIIIERTYPHAHTSTRERNSILIHVILGILSQKTPNADEHLLTIIEHQDLSIKTALENGLRRAIRTIRFSEVAQVYDDFNLQARNLFVNYI